MLAFTHPLAGRQLVKGGIEPNESLADACRRELFEESGLHAEPGRMLGKLEVRPGELWGFVLMDCRHAVFENQWSHRTGDDGGLTFNFYWRPLAKPPGTQWHSTFVAAVGFLQQRLLQPGGAGRFS